MFEISAYTHVESINSIVCIIPLGSFGSYQTTLSLLSNIGEEHDISALDGSIPFYVVAAVTNLSPLRVQASNALITFVGTSFEAGDDKYQCIFSCPNATGYKWLPDQTLIVSAIEFENGVLCDASSWGQLFPAGNVSAMLIERRATTVLSSAVSRDSTHINISSSYFATRQDGAIESIYAGVFIRIASEILYVLEIANSTQSNTTSLLVLRGQGGSEASTHENDELVYVLVYSSQLINANQTPKVEIMPSFELNTTVGLTAGGDIVDIRASGLNATYLPGSQELNSFDLLSQFSLLSRSTNAIFFDLFAIRSVNITGLAIFLGKKVLLNLKSWLAMSPAAIIRARAVICQRQS